MPDAPREPDMVFLYRRAILDYWTESEETLDEIITHVLVHEIGHHFGFSDARYGRNRGSVCWLERGSVRNTQRSGVRGQILSL